MRYAGDTLLTTVNGVGSQSRKIALEAVRLLLSVEADLEPDAASLARNGFERGWSDFAVIQPGSDLVHGLPEGGPSQLLFDMHDERRIERHIALLPMAHEAGAFFWGSLLVPRLWLGAPMPATICPLLIRVYKPDQSLPGFEASSLSAPIPR